jgi:phosphoenolpyruvate carboxylase
VKLSEQNWEQFIFEAISHKRFSNRSWFAYRISQAGKPLPKAIEYYAERYKVGIIQILLNDEELVKLKSAKSDIVEELVDRIHERVPALYEHVPLQEKADLFERAKILPTFSFE